MNKTADNNGVRCMVSFCMPTNGITEWVIPALDSIYEQNAPDDEFEVIVADNGDNNDFQNAILKYQMTHKNLIYKKTQAKQFLNQIESFKMAKGEFIKFVNHRFLLKDGTVQQILTFVKENIKDKPVVFFSNGNLKQKEKVSVYNSFDEFVGGLSYWSSWSGGLAIWKSDFEKMSDQMTYNETFPHTTVLFYEREKQKYIIDDTIIMCEETGNAVRKGNYNLFKAFAAEYLSVIRELEKSKDISEETFECVKKDNIQMVGRLYFLFVVMKNKASYDLTDYKKYITEEYKMRQIKKAAFHYFILLVLNKIGIKIL